MQGIVSIIVFALLVVGSFLIFGIKFPKKKNIISISKAAAKNKRKVVDEMFQHIEDKEDLMGILLEMFMDASKSLLATDTEDKTAKNATWEIV